MPKSLDSVLAHSWLHLLSVVAADSLLVQI